MGNLATHPCLHFLSHVPEKEPPWGDFPVLFVLAKPVSQPNKLLKHIYLGGLCKAQKKKKKKCFRRNPEQGNSFKWHLLLNIRQDFTAFRGIPTPFPQSPLPSTPAGGEKSLHGSRCAGESGSGRAHRRGKRGRCRGRGAGRGARRAKREPLREKGPRPQLIKVRPPPPATLSFGVRMKYGNRI